MPIAAAVLSLLLSGKIHNVADSVAINIAAIVCKGARSPHDFEPATFIVPIHELHLAVSDSCTAVERRQLYR